MVAEPRKPESVPLSTSAQLVCVLRICASSFQPDTIFEKFCGSNPPADEHDFSTRCFSRCDADRSPSNLHLGSATSIVFISAATTSIEVDRMIRFCSCCRFALACIVAAIAAAISLPSAMRAQQTPAPQYPNYPSEMPDRLQPATSTFDYVRRDAIGRHAGWCSPAHRHPRSRKARPMLRFCSRVRPTALTSSPRTRPAHTSGRISTGMTTPSMSFSKVATSALSTTSAASTARKATM